MHGEKGALNIPGGDLREQHVAPPTGTVQFARCLAEVKKRLQHATLSAPLLLLWQSVCQAPLVDTNVHAMYTTHAYVET